MTIFYNVCTKRRPKDFLTISLKVDNKFTSNLALGASNNFLVTWHKKNFHFTSRMYAHYLVKALKAMKRNKN